MKQFKQTKEYDCGVYALRYLLHLKNIKLKPTEKELKTTFKNGTNPENICRYLAKKSVKYEVHKYNSPAVLVNQNWQPPILALYRWDNDDHYGVITKNKDETIAVFNPFTAETCFYPLREFVEIWYSNIYGPKYTQWALKIL